MFSLSRATCPSLPSLQSTIIAQSIRRQLGANRWGRVPTKSRENLCGLTWPAAGIRQTLEERNVAPGVAQHRQRAGTLPFRKPSWQRVARKSDKWNRILLTALADERESASDNGNTEDRTPVPSTRASRRNDQAG